MDYQDQTIWISIPRKSADPVLRLGSVKLVELGDVEKACGGRAGRLRGLNQRALGVRVRGGASGSASPLDQVHGRRRRLLRGCGGTQGTKGRKAKR